MNRQSAWHVGRNDQGGAATHEEAQRPAPAVAEVLARIEALEQRQRPTRGARQLRRRIATPAVAVGLVVALTGIAHAAIGGGRVITGCSRNAALRGQHALTLIDPGAGGRCASGQTTITWNQTGPQGPKGDTGPQGPKGETGATDRRGPPQSQES